MGSETKASGKKAAKAPAPLILLLGSALFLGAVPAAFLLVLSRLAPSLIRPWPPAPWDKAVFMAAGALGLVFVVWTIRVQRRAEGTPAPFAPPGRLIKDGPYRLCRNPLVFGTVCCNLALGSLAAGLAPGVILAACVGLGLWLYNRLVEEKGLRERFGAEYENYRKGRPFMLPLGRPRK